MNKIKLAGLAASAFLVSTTHAFAFNFGFVRVPDWMDRYIVWLLAISAACFVGLFLTKPRGVPFKQVSQVTLSPTANFFRFALGIAFGALMLMVFVGMGLRRYAEA